MHRVELKVKADKLNLALCNCVPNAPCGVERFLEEALPVRSYTFLMHRVELKVKFLSCQAVLVL